MMAKVSGFVQDLVEQHRLFGSKEAFTLFHSKVANQIHHSLFSIGSEHLEHLDNAIVETNWANITWDEDFSVIIPTLNAGPRFEHCLSSIKAQINVGRIEIIIVDSGSTDKTVEIAKKMNVRLIQIDKSDFSHSQARNLGAEQAKYQNLFFTVQDAFIPHTNWLFKLCSILHQNQLSAVSTVEKAGEQASLYSKFAAYGHQKFMGAVDKDRLMTMPNSTNPALMRQNSNLSNIACLIHKQVFDEYKFRGSYGEDVDLGLRLIKDKKKLGLVSSLKINHFHERPLLHHLKRSYADAYFLTKTFKNECNFPHSNLSDLLEECFYCWSINLHLNNDNSLNLSHSESSTEFSRRFFSLLHHYSQVIDHQNVHLPVKTGKDLQEINQFFLKINISTLTANKSIKRPGQILIGIKNHLMEVCKFIHSSESQEDDFKIKAFIDCVNKVFTDHIGQAIGEWVADHEQSIESEKFNDLHFFLSKNI
ncbi:MAG: glycosyltransferase [Chloroflexota bacterium]